MNTMIKTCKIRHLATAVAVVAGLAGPAAYAGQPAAAHAIQAQGEQALTAIRGEIAASVKESALPPLSLPAMTIYSPPLDHAARRLQATAVRQIRNEIKHSIAQKAAVIPAAPRRAMTVAEASGHAPHARAAMFRAQ
jgi:hypothetical protein